MFAVVDIGTNSVRLLLAEKAGSKLKPVKTMQTITRLGQGVNATKNLSEEAVLRTCNVLVKYQKLLDEYQVQNPVVIATSAVRDAENRSDFLKAVMDKTGWEVKVLTGKEEAQASFMGAVKVLESNNYQLDDEVVVLDIGGGSTEILRGFQDGEIITGGTSQVGAVRMTELCITKHPIETNELNCMLGLINRRIAPLVNQCTAKYSKFTLVGVGGTITTAASLELGLTEYNPTKITGLTLTNTTVQKWLFCLAKMDLKTRAALSGLCKGREDIIVAGLAILHVVMNLMDTELVVSDGDLMQGYSVLRQC
ncbi:MAG: Ppx/GppA family phosphatase [Firmicutes bacterium]|nr:Ppx/GppA family phosphatase [Bacillota bacterium]